MSVVLYASAVTQVPYLFTIGYDEGPPAGADGNLVLHTAGRGQDCPGRIKLQEMQGGLNETNSSISVL
jgi:hypothetical protein